MNALQTKIAETGTEMLLITATNLDGMECASEEERMVRALVNEELALRFPETAEALDDWYLDLESELTMFQVILVNLKEMPKAA